MVSRIFEHQLLADLFKNIFHKTFLGTENIRVVLQHFSHLLNNGRKISTNTIGTITIDLSKAFDCLSHDLILEKLKFYGLSDHALSPLRSYPSSRYQRALKLSDAFSAWQEVSRGVPRGSILGPKLFELFMNDLEYAIKQCGIVNYADATKIHFQQRNVCSSRQP